MGSIQNGTSMSGVVFVFHFTQAKRRHSKLFFAFGAEPFSFESDFGLGFRFTPPPKKTKRTKQPENPQQKHKTKKEET